MHKTYKKIVLIFILLMTFLMLLSNFSYANSYSNNSISIEVTPEKRAYDYKEDVSINIKIENKNRYANLFYKITEIYTGGGFNAMNLQSGYEKIDSFSSNEIKVTMHDNFINERPEVPIDTHITFNNGYTPVIPDNDAKSGIGHNNNYEKVIPDNDAKSGIGHKNSYYSKIKKYNIGRHAYEITEAEYNELKKFRKEKTPNERLSNNDSVGRLSKEKESFTRGANATLLIIIIIVLICIIFVIFVWFIVNAKSKDGSKFLSFLLIIGLLLLTTKRNTYAADTYQENVHYNKEVNTRCTYWDLDCSFTIKVEYYFENTIAPITDITLDTDSDNLPDYLEVLYLTDFNNPDTDSDGIPDGDEVYYTFTDPMRVDTDNNGVLDGDEDYDKDGLTNKEEIENNTRPDLIDTDFDSLSDFDEINGVKTKNGYYTYQTDPTNDDTDGDGLRDDVELKLNLNPTNPSDANTRVSQEMSRDLIPNNLTVDATTPISFKGEVKGFIDENVSVKLATDKYYDNLRGSVGEPIRIETSYGGDDGLKVVYDLTKYKDKIKKIKLFRYSNGKLEIVNNQYISGNTIIGDVLSGEYVLVDTQVLLQEVNLFIK